jgi:alanyl aminopeptidase
MPVCISGSFKGKRERQCIILEDEQGTIEFDTRQCPDYVVPNDAASGYYRGDLESSAWEDLTAAFTSLPESEALWLIDSARASTELRRMAGQSLLRLIEEAAKHPSELVRSEALSQASDLLVLARDTRAASGAKNWAAGLANTFQSAMGGSASASASDLSRLAAFRALRLDHSATRADLFERLKAYMAGQDGREAPALTSDEFAAAIAVTLDRGGSGVVDVLLTAMETRDDSSFGAAVIAGLGASKEPAQIARAQAIMQSGEYGPSATFNIAQALMTNDRARESTWSLLNENFETFVDQIPAQWQRNTPRLAIAFCDPARANEVKAFFDQYGGKAEGHAQALAETLDSLPACAATRANLKAELEAAFTAR